MSYSCKPQSLDNNYNLHLAIVNNKYNDPVSVFKHTKKVITSDLATFKIFPYLN
jgi:hypothetical protein